MAPQSQRRLEILGLFLAALAFAVGLAWPLETLDRAEATPDPADADAPQLAAPPPWLLPLDDAYIFIRYAQQAARGRPLEWSDGQFSTGASNFLYPWLLVPAQWLFDGLEGWSRWSSLVGLLSLWGLGLAGLRLLRAAGVGEPWPLAGALALIWSGPIGWVSIGGMDSAFGSAALLFACALWIEATVPRDAAARADGPRRHAGLLIVIGLLPFARPDFAVLVGLAAIAVALGRGPGVPRWIAPCLLVPGGLFALLNWSLTGYAAPGGVLAKAVSSSAFMSPYSVLVIYAMQFRHGLLDAYAGLRFDALPPGIGPLAAATCLAVVVCRLGGKVPALSRFFKRQERLWHSLLPLCVVWLATLATAPLSGYLIWQYMRHHHHGFACAWILATAGLAVALQELASLCRRRGLFAGLHARRWRWLVLGLPCLLLIGLPEWSFQYFRQAVNHHQGNGRLAEWLSEHRRDEVLLVHDAGLLAVVHDGAAVDVMGLGTTAFALPFRDGPGAVVETLARQPRLPELAATWGTLFDVPSLFGRRLMALGLGSKDAAIHEIRRELLAATRLREPGVDFASHDAERHLRVDWQPSPGSVGSSVALTLAGADGQPQLHGCRPLRERLRLELPAGTAAVRLRGAALPDEGARLRIFAGGDEGLEVGLDKDAPSWTNVEVPVNGATLRLERVGPETPCLESIAFLNNRPD